MRAKRLWKTLLYPPWAVAAGLALVSGVGLIYAFYTWQEQDVRRIFCYVLAFYALVLLCLRVPSALRAVRNFRQHNRYYLRYAQDVRLRMNISLFGACLYNAGYAVFQLGLGVIHRSVWFYAMAGYYALLAAMRLMLGLHVRAHEPGEEKRREWQKYRICGAGLLMMNGALSVFVLAFVQNLRAVAHHEITVIAMAAYTFGALTLAIVNVVRFRRYQSPVCSAAKALSLAAAAVSMLSLEDAMLTTFDRGAGEMFPRVMLGASGAAAALFIVMMAAYMLWRAHRNLCMETEI